MTIGLTPKMENEDNSTNTSVLYTRPSVTQGQSPEMTNIKASTNLTLVHEPS